MSLPQAAPGHPNALIDQARARAKTAGRGGKAQKMKRVLLFFAGTAAGVAGIVALAATIGWPLSLNTGHHYEQPTHAAKGAHGHEHGPPRVALSTEQIADVGITLAEAKGGTLRRHFLAPGSLIPDADHVARVSVRVLATVAELRKRLGDTVERGEIVAAIESREVADAKSEYLAARVTNELQQTLYARQKVLVETAHCHRERVPAHPLAASEAQIKLDGARQKLFTLGLSEGEIADLPNQPAESLRKQYLRSPIAGRVAERRVDLGGADRAGRAGKRTIRHRRSRRALGRSCGLARGHRRGPRRRLNEHLVPSALTEKRSAEDNFREPAA